MASWILKIAYWWTSEMFSFFKLIMYKRVLFKKKANMKPQQVLVKKASTSTGFFFSEVQSELNYDVLKHAVVSRNQSGPFPSLHFYLWYTLHSRNKCHLQERSQKSKFPTDLRPQGLRGACSACTQTRFKQSLWLHYRRSSSSPLHPSLDTRNQQARPDTPGIAHSLTS